MGTDVTRRTVLQLAAAPVFLAKAQSGDMAPTTSKVYPGPDGRLVYVPDERGNVIHDASHAGYRGGGVGIPTVPVKETIWPVPGDNTAHIQAAIDRVSALPLDRTGFRGTVLLRAGYYRMATPITIQASGVVLRGEGMGDTGTILIGTGTGRPAQPAGAPGVAAGAAAPAAPAAPGGAAAAAPGGAAGAAPAQAQAPAPGAGRVAGPGAPPAGGGPAGAPAAPGGRGAGPGPAGAGGPGAGGRGGRGGAGGGGGGAATLVRVAGPAAIALVEGSRQAVTDDYVPVGARSFTVASAVGFRVGDTVILRRIGNQAWINEVGMNSDTPGGRWQPFNVDYDRVITEIQGNRVTVDVPIFCAIEQRWGGGELIKYTETGRIENVGIENLRAVSEFDPSVRTRDYGNMDRNNYAAEEYYSDENHYNNFVVFDNVKNGWVRNATALHFVTSMVGTQRGAKWITIQDCVSREPISQRRGARRFVFALRGQLALVQRCQSDKGRHSFMTGQPNGSGNVFLDCKATSPFSSSEPHEQWATGSLYDNIEAPLTARFWKNITIGWAGANTVFWNCKGDFMVQKPPTAQNYVFGHIGVNAVVYNIPLQDTTKENGHLESLDRHVSPRSLYLTQLRERLGDAAVRAVATPAQIG